MLDKNDPVEGCETCKTTAGRSGCPRHRLNRFSPGFVWVTPAKTVDKERFENQPDNMTIKIPIKLAWSIMSLLTGICIGIRADEMSYTCQALSVHREFSKLLEPYRTGGVENG